MFTLRDIVGIAVQVEQNGERTYRTAAAKVKDPKLAGLLGKLADEEASHARWFADLGGRIERIDVGDELADLGNNMLRGIVSEETFSLSDVDLARAAGVKEVLEAATELEGDTIIFYQMLASFVGDAAIVEHIEAIIEEEQRHGRLLTEYLEGKPLPRIDVRGRS